MNGILFIGFLPEIIPKVAGYTNIIHRPYPNGAESISPTEYKLMCNETLDSSRLLLVNLNKEHFSPDEIYLIVTAQRHGKPIIGSGLKITHLFLDAFLNNKFQFIEDAVSHIRTIY